VVASVASNTFVVTGAGEEMTMTDVISQNPSILAQLGAGALSGLQQMAQKLSEEKTEENADNDDDDVPDLVEDETFDANE
jgi:hypothetical protein